MRHTCFSSGVLPFIPVPVHQFVLPYLVLNTQDEVYADQAAFFFRKGQNGLLVCWLLYVLVDIDHFTVVFSVTWPLNGSETGGDLVLVQNPKSLNLIG